MFIIRIKNRNVLIMPLRKSRILKEISDSSPGASSHLLHPLLNQELVVVRTLMSWSITRVGT